MAADGTQCLATRIASNYSDNQTFAGSTATSPDIVLPMNVAYDVTFRMWVDTEGSTYDGFNLSIMSGSTTALHTAVTPAYPLTVGGQAAWGGHQASQGWQPVRADLSAYSGQTIRLLFAFRSDSSGNFPGVYLDDLHLVPR
jgi:bacillopeptidase F (M6 metalloprotease family)